MRRAVYATLTVLCGCAMQPKDSSEVLNKAGLQPSKAVAEEVIAAHLRSTLKDPDSIKQFEITGGPMLRAWYRGALLGGGYDEGWMVCFVFNAKNSYGGYVGLKREAAMLRQFESGWRMVAANWGLVPDPCPRG